MKSLTTFSHVVSSLIRVTMGLIGTELELILKVTLSYHYLILPSAVHLLLHSSLKEIPEIIECERDNVSLLHFLHFRLVGRYCEGYSTGPECRS